MPKHGTQKKIWHCPNYKRSVAYIVQDYNPSKFTTGGPTLNGRTLRLSIRVSPTLAAKLTELKRIFCTSSETKTSCKSVSRVPAF